jgi:hypothetical protein
MKKFIARPKTLIQNGTFGLTNTLVTREEIVKRLNKEGANG